MFRKKTLYIILLIVFTLILCAEAALCAFLPDRLGKMENFSGFDPSNMQMPEGFDSENMPEGFDPSKMGGMQMPGGFDSENMPEGFDPSNMGDMRMPSGMNIPTAMPASGQNRSGILYTLKSLWLPIVLTCVFADAFCIFMLIRISRKRPKEEPQESEEPALKSEKTDKKDLHKKKKRNRIISLIIVVVFVAVVAILPTILGKERDMSSVEIKEEVLSASAERGSITNALLSGGVLTDDDAISVSIPATVEISELFVENGDTVKEGDLIATVEKSSIMIAIAEMQNAMDALDERLEEAADDTVETTLKMPSKGRVKKIYAAEGDDVVEVMYEHGALMLVSLDGMMAVDIETDVLSVGEHVTVALSDGSEEVGRVVKLAKKSAVITISDESAEFGEKATVLDENGKQLGSGELYINSELKITGYAGTVSKIYAEENDQLSAGEKLLLTEEDNYTANYSALYKERTELEERLMKLLEIYRDGGIYAEYSGEITGIADEEEDETEEESNYSPGMQSGTIVMQPRLASAEVSGENGGEPPTDISGIPGGNQSGQGTSQLHGTYYAKITKVSYGAIDVMISAEPAAAVDFKVDEALLTVRKKLTPAADTPVFIYSDGEKLPKTLSDLEDGDLLLCEFAEDGILISILYQRTEQQPGQPQMPSGGGMMPNIGGSSMGGTIQQTVEKYKLTETVVCEIIPDEFMTVSISVDELDILSVSLGQKAMIRPDSMAGQAFEGEVVEIDRIGTNDGGNTKYTVMLKLAREASMLSGMNASVSIDFEQYTDVLTVPVEALYELGTKTVLYTAYDEEEDILSAPVEVTIGYSDGDIAEVTSGLLEGDEYWYRYADAIEYSFS